MDNADADPTTEFGTDPRADAGTDPGGALEANTGADPEVIPDGGDPAHRGAAVEHVLSEVYPDRLEATATGMKRTDDGTLVGVKAEPRGYFSTAKYALVTVADDGRVVGADAVTGRELRRELGEDDGG